MLCIYEKICSCCGGRLTGDAIELSGFRHPRSSIETNIIETAAAACVATADRFTAGARSVLKR